MLENITTEELRAELDRRENAEKEIAKPKQLESMDFTALRSLCQRYIDDIDKVGGYVDENYRHYIYETAISAIFGKGVWEWINQKRK